MESKKGNRSQRATAVITRDVLRGLMRVHILHHAAQGPIFGLEMIEELRHHGYSIGPGTLYPMLHALETSGVLSSSQVLVEGKNRRYYRSTKIGEALLADLRLKVREFVDEVLEESQGARQSSRRKIRA